MDQRIEFDQDLIRRYDIAGPRYTSYPTAVQFHESFGAESYRAAAAATNAEASLRPLSLYFHIPFCDTVCFYCACNKVVTKNRSRAAPYLERLHREIAMQGALFDRSRTVEQLHWGGGTPTFISHDEMRELMRQTGEYFTLCDQDTGEYSIEVDPREVHHDTIALLRRLGFNRMSLGVQDFDPSVQEAVNRIQSERATFSVVEQARREGFKSLSVDLIYGLPFQSASSFTRTLEKIVDIAPDRLSVFNYAHLPQLFKPQRRINADDLPSAAEKLDILQATIDLLTQAGYVYIGMDHFAKPTDELAVAQRNGTLYRNFQGYSTHADCDLVAMGITSIGMVGDTYSQNVRDLDSYYLRIDAGELPIFRGIALTAEDRLRRRIITELICHFELDVQALEREHGIVFAEHFARELDELAGMQADGLIEINADILRVLPAGRLLIRNICMVFDAYLQKDAGGRYSKVI